MKRNTKKNIFMMLFLGLLFLYPSMTQSQPEKFLEKFFGPRVSARDLRVVQLEMNPDPVREGQRVSFSVTITNSSQSSARVDLFIKDQDEVVTSAYDVYLRPGDNQVAFPWTNYRFSRRDHCFAVEVDIDQTRRPIDLAKEFCARKTFQGWSLSSPRIGPLLVEDLDTYPDPFMPGQDLRFRARLRNDGRPIRVDISIQDKDQVVTKLNDVLLPRGVSEFLFPYTRYPFQRLDHCFTVVVDVEKTPYRVDAVREFCARPYSWSLRP